MEQKNGAVVRRTVGYRRFEGLKAAAALARLYGSLRLFVNFFQPSFKLAIKARDGAKITKRYHAPATPYQRLLADPRTPAEARHGLEALYATLDPVRLLREIRAANSSSWRSPTGRRWKRVCTDNIDDGGVPQQLANHLAARRGAPDGTSEETAKRGRRRPDPLVTVTAQLRTWFEAEPWRAARELLERLQSEQADACPSGILRTLQRRVKEWRREKAHAMIFGADDRATVDEATGALHLGSIPE